MHSLIKKVSQPQNIQRGINMHCIFVYLWMQIMNIHVRDLQEQIICAAAAFHAIDYHWQVQEGFPVSLITWTLNYMRTSKDSGK